MSAQATKTEDIYERLANALEALPHGFARTPSGVEFELMKKAFTPEEAELAGQLTRTAETVSADALSPLFEAVVEATEEAILNSLFRAEAVRGPRGTGGALPLDSVLPLLREYRVIR